jgi:hypothetical protein
MWREARVRDVPSVFGKTTLASGCMRDPAVAHFELSTVTYSPCITVVRFDSLLWTLCCALDWLSGAGKIPGFPL